MSAVDMPVNVETQVKGAAWWRAPLTAFLITRVLILVIILLADAFLPGFNGIHVYESGDFGSDFLNAWDRWDTTPYVDIVENGYSYVPGYPRNNVAYFPLYPLAVATLTPITRSPLLAGLIISNACFLAALLVFQRLVALKTSDESTANRAVFYIAAVPTGFFFAAVYTESLFLLLSVASAYFALRRQWLWAGIAGAFAAATRTTGFLLVFLVGFAWLETHGWTFNTIMQRSSWQNLQRALRREWVTLIPILLIPVGLLLYMLYLGRAFGDPFASVKAVSGWRQPISLQSFLNDVQLLLDGQLYPSFIMDMVVFFMVMALIVPIGRRFGAGYASYTAISLLLPALSGVMSITRYATVLFPVFMLLAVWTRRTWIDLALRTGFLIFLPLFALAFVKNVFIG